MFILSKLFNTLIAIMFSFLLVISLTLAIYAFSSVEVLTDRENLRDWLTMEDTQEALIDYVIEKSFSPALIEIGEKLLGVDKYEELVYNQLAKDASNYLTDSTIDGVYDWLEGEANAPIVTLSLEEANLDQEEINDRISAELGILSEFIDLSDIFLKSTDIKILDLDESTLDRIPQIFANLHRIPQVLLGLSFIFAFLVIFAAPSWRKKLLFIGLALVATGLLLLFGYKFYSADEILQSILFRGIGVNFPSLDQIPKFMQLILTEAGTEIQVVSSTYGKYLLAVGIVISILSQLAVKGDEGEEYEIEDTPEWTSEEGYDYDSEEMEESEEESL